VYVDGTLKHTQTVAGSDPFRLPAGFKGLKWQIELLGANAITAVMMANTMAELSQS
jgi:hypothetical protein